MLASFVSIRDLEQVLNTMQWIHFLGFALNAALVHHLKVWNYLTDRLCISCRPTKSREAAVEEICTILQPPDQLIRISNLQYARRKLISNKHFRIQVCPIPFGLSVLAQTEYPKLDSTKPFDSRNVIFYEESI